MRKASKKKVTLEEAAEDKAALEEIARIRRNGFNPLPDPSDPVREDPVNAVIQKLGPERALKVMQAAAYVCRKIVPVH
jgi:hypothetical protein